MAKFRNATNRVLCGINPYQVGEINRDMSKNVFVQAGWLIQESAARQDNTGPTAKERAEAASQADLSSALEAMADSAKSVQEAAKARVLALIAEAESVEGIESDDPEVAEAIQLRAMELEETSE